MEQPQTHLIDTSLLRDPGVVDFIARQPSGTVIYVPEKAKEIAREMIDFVEAEAHPSWLWKFMPRMAVKALNHPPVVEKVLELFSADVASVEEVRLCTWASKGSVAPNVMGYSNLWASREELHKAVNMGVREFVVHDEYAMACLQEADTWLKRAKEGPIQITLRVRIAPPSALNWDQGDKFGMPLDEMYIRKMIDRAWRHKLVVKGFSFHVGTENSYQNSILQGIELFENYGKAIEMIAPLRNQLCGEGRLGFIVNTEGGYRRSSASPEYHVRAVMHSQISSFQKNFRHPVEWVTEPGRYFTDCGVGRLEVTHVDEELRAGDHQPYVGLNTSVYTGAHDASWAQPLLVREQDVLSGNIYTHQSHPDRFSRYMCVGVACATSDQFGFRSDKGPILLPVDLRPGEVLLALPFGSYTTSLGPQAYQMMDGTYRGVPEKGFNGIPWLHAVTYQGPLG